MASRRVFLLSPARLTGQRARSLLNPGATLPLALRLRQEGVPLGELYSFMSGLYFRGKYAYSQAFSSPPEGVCGSWIIMGGGLLPGTTRWKREHMEAAAHEPIDPGNPRYVAALQRDATQLALAIGPNCQVVLLGSIATPKYLRPLVEVFGSQLVFPEAFIGRGDMSRGGLLLRCAVAQTELAYIPLGATPHHGPKPARLPSPRAIVRPRKGGRHSLA